jgi:hypothetical protein
MHPGFPILNVEWGAIWDTSKPIDDDLMDDENDQDEDFDESEGGEEEDGALRHTIVPIKAGTLGKLDLR